MPRLTLSDQGIDRRMAKAKVRKVG